MQIPSKDLKNIVSNIFANYYSQLNYAVICRGGNHGKYKNILMSPILLIPHVESGENVNQVGISCSSSWLIRI